MENASGLEGKTKARGNQLAIIKSSPSKIRPANNNNCEPAGQNNSDAIDESVQGGTESSKAGNPDLLRSQLKRPIKLSESDESHELLTKKPAKGSKQSSTLKLMEECQRQTNPQDNAILTSEIALNVDLVVKSLFRYMNCSKLKSCRLVCKKWKYFGAKELQCRRNVTIELSFGYVIDKSEKSAQSLLNVMQNAEAKTFPCTSFHVSTKELSFPRIRNFLSVAEAQNPIKKLSLVLNYEKKRLPLKKSTLLEDLRDLIFHQVPNLEDLEISFILPTHWDDGLSTLDYGFFHLENSPQLLPRLTSLDLSGATIPRKLFENVIDAAVNLKSYGGFHFSPELLEYFANGNGKHRIHLLKHLCFNIFGEFVEVMERLVTQHGGDLKLESFFIYNPLTGLNDGAEILSRASSLISQLLRSSKSTMKRIGITPMRFLPGLAIPRLPNLGCIYVGGFIGDENDIANTFLFPYGFSLAKKFPNLSIVSFKRGLTLKLLEMLIITEPVISVFWSKTNMELMKALLPI